MIAVRFLAIRRKPCNVMQPVGWELSAKGKFHFLVIRSDTAIAALSCSFPEKRVLSVFPEKSN